VGLGLGQIVLDGNPAPLPKKGVEVGFGPGDIVLDWDAAPPPQKKIGISLAPNFQPMSVVAKRCTYQHTTWCGGKPQFRRHCVRWGPISPFLKGHSPNFRQCPLWPTAGWTKVPLGTDVGSAQATLCSMWTQLPPGKRHSPTQSLAPFCCGQTARWIKMPLDAEENLGSGNVVLVAATLPKKGTAPSFRPMSIVAKRLDG